MNPLTNVRNIKKLNEQELQLGIFDEKRSWHNQYKDSAYIFIGGLPYDLTEGDILCVFSQYGEIVNINLVRDKKTGKSKGYAFIAYQDQRSTILAVDNFNSMKLGGRTIRVDHVEEYRRPKSDEKDESGKYVDKIEVGCAPKLEESSSSPSDNEEDAKRLKHSKKAKKKHKKEKKSKKKKKKTDHYDSSEEESHRTKKYNFEHDVRISKSQDFDDDSKSIQRIGRDVPFSRKRSRTPSPSHLYDKEYKSRSSTDKGFRDNDVHKHKKTERYKTADRRYHDDRDMKPSAHHRKKEKGSSDRYF